MRAAATHSSPLEMDPLPSCLIPEFTAECTDECLVLACDDPDHGAQTCLVTDGSTPCDGTCIAAAACNDCTGLDAIVSTSPPHPPTSPHLPSSCSVAPTTTRTSPTATVSRTCMPSPSLSPYRPSSPTSPVLPPRHPLRPFHHTSSPPPPFPPPCRLSTACGQIVAPSSAPCPISSAMSILSICVP